MTLSFSGITLSGISVSSISAPVLPQVGSATMLWGFLSKNLGLSPSDSVNTVPDQYGGSGVSFTATDGQALTYFLDADNKSYIVGDANLQWLTSNAAASWLDNFPQLAVYFMWSIHDVGAQGSDNEVISKYDPIGAVTAFWQFSTVSNDIATDSFHFFANQNSLMPTNDIRYISAYHVFTYDSGDLWIDGDNSNTVSNDNPPVTTTSNSQPVHLLLYSFARLYGLLIYNRPLNDADRSSVTAWMTSNI